MTNLIFFLAVQTILLGCSLRLEAETTYKGSKEYNSLRNWAGGGLCVAWVSLCILYIINTSLGLF